MIKKKIGIIGIGYVGLPLAVAFARKYDVIAFDLKKNRINDLKKNKDINNDISVNKLKKAKKLFFTSETKNLSTCNIYIVTVPTPINKKNIPDLSILKSACKLVAQFLKRNDIVIFESTVYPGVTEEICIPILENKSKLLLNKSFLCGYSPERINPNDKKHTIEKIKKVTSGSNKKAAKIIDDLYSSIIQAGTYKAPSIKVAEAAKVIENAQRDINIAFMNELSLIFDKLDLNTNHVLKAASTKWNFLNFEPGLVGGHCIGVDPFYLTYKSILEGYRPKIILSGRKVNDNMPVHIFKKSFNRTKNKFKDKKKLKFLILGATFKEDCYDLRNSKSLVIRDVFIKNNINVDIYDPLINKIKIDNEYSFLRKSKPKKNYYHCVIIAVKHKEFKKWGEKTINSFLVKGGLIFDIKNVLPFKNTYIYL